MEDMETINDLKTRLIVLEIAVKVLYGHVSQPAKDELADIGNEYLDMMLAQPISDLNLELLAQSLRAIHRK